MPLWVGCKIEGFKLFCNRLIDLQNPSYYNIRKNNQNAGGYSAPDYIKTVTAPSLGEEAYEEFRHERTKLVNEDQDLPFDNTYQGKKTSIPSQSQKRRVPENYFW